MAGRTRKFKARGKGGDGRLLVHIDNHRSARFGAALHEDIPAVISADEMWTRYEAMLKAKEAEHRPQSLTASITKIFAANTLADNNWLIVGDTPDHKMIHETPHLTQIYEGTRYIWATPSAELIDSTPSQFIETPFKRHSDLPFAEVNAAPHPHRDAGPHEFTYFDDTTSFLELSGARKTGRTSIMHSPPRPLDPAKIKFDLSPLSEEMRQKLLDIINRYWERVDEDNIDKSEPAQAEATALHDAPDPWRYEGRLDPSDPLAMVWREIQETMPPDPELDEDVVNYSLEGLILSLPDDIKYVMLGDTNHGDNDLREFLSYETSCTEALHRQGFKHGIMEMPQAFQPMLKQFMVGEINEKTLRTDIEA
ncbi:MAG: hypothetical protein GC136_00030 [Alphaproteobacteria bacterium]|nr:hypothetical protein [Alphaproteobacteria bacterium]